MMKVTNDRINEGATICIYLKKKCHSVSFPQDENRILLDQNKMQNYIKKLYLKSIECSLAQKCRYICTYILGSAEGKLNI